MDAATRIMERRITMSDRKIKRRITMSDRKIIYADDAIDAIYKCTDYYIGNLPIMIDKSDAYKALAALPSAQIEQKWTPCSDPSDLPKDKRLWITREIYGARIVYDVVWDMTEWSDDISDVVAYMPYWEPEPYAEW